MGTVYRQDSSLPEGGMTTRQQNILSTFARYKNAGVIPYMRCEKDDPEIRELAEDGHVKIEQHEVDGRTLYDFAPIFDSPVFSGGIGAPHVGQVGKTVA